MSKEKEDKTNAMRVLDRHGVHYKVLTYECTEFVDAVHAAESAGEDVERTFKTLVAKGRSERYSVFVIPAAAETDLKKAAKAVGEKSVELVPVKDINKVTGYVRGGCSPLGMKRVCRTIIHESALSFDTVYISGGRLGCSIELDPGVLPDIIDAGFDDIILH